jgi:two-component system NtrC family response regulator
MPEAVARLERAMIERALRQTRGNRAQAAERLGIRRQLLYDKIARYRLEASENRTDAVSDQDETTFPNNR